MLVFGRRHLEVVLAEYVEHYNRPESTNPRSIQTFINS
jgi:hypothetical protein